jgi:hypothetical protein
MVHQNLTGDQKQHWFYISSDLLYNVEKFNLAPCNFWLFPKLKDALKGQKIADIPDIQHNMTTLL